MKGTLYQENSQNIKSFFQNPLEEELGRKKKLKEIERKLNGKLKFMKLVTHKCHQN